jgi:ankyrin repeat protein
MQRIKSIKRQFSQSKVEEARLRLNPTPPNPHRFRKIANRPSDPADINWQDPDDFFRTRLHKAVESANVELVAQLLTDGASPFVTNIDHRTPLGDALMEGHFEIGRVIAASMTQQRRAWHIYKMKWDRQYRHKRKTMANV